MSDVFFIEEWLAPRKSCWILHSAFKSNGMQMSVFRAVPRLLLLSWPKASALWVCSYSPLRFFFLMPSPTCSISVVHVILNSACKTESKVLHYFRCSQPQDLGGEKKVQTENLVRCCSEIMRLCCSIEPEVALFNVQIPLSQIQQPLRESLIYLNKHMKPVAALCTDCMT